MTAKFNTTPVVSIAFYESANFRSNRGRDRRTPQGSSEISEGWCTTAMRPPRLRMDNSTATSASTDAAWSGT